MLLALTRTRINAGNAMTEPTRQPAQGTDRAKRDRSSPRASEGWRRYLKAADEPSAGGAQVVAGVLFGLAEDLHGTRRNGGKRQAAAAGAADRRRSAAEPRDA